MLSSNMKDITREFLAYTEEVSINCSFAVDDNFKLFFKDNRKYLKPLYFLVMDLTYSEALEALTKPDPSLSFKILIDEEVLDFKTTFEKPSIV